MTALTNEQLEALDRLNQSHGQESSAVDSLGDGQLSPAPCWPSGVFPCAVDAYVKAQAAAIGVPEEMVAVPLLVFAGGAVGNAVELQLKSGWTVLPSLWAGLIAEPGAKKSPTLKAAQWPLNVLQNKLYKQWQADMAEHESIVHQWEAKPKGERGERPQPPQLDHLYTTDVTIEALVDILSRGRGLSIIIDELSGFIASFDRYRGGKGGDRQQYLSLWSNSPVKADRKGGGTVYATHPVGSVYGGIQPDLARALHSHSGQRDGMVERFLLFRPDVVRSGWTDDAVDPALIDPLVATFASMRTIHQRTLEASAHGQERITVQFHPDARHLFIEWFNANDETTEHTAGLRQGFYSKFDSQLSRIALILHCMHNVEDPRVMLSESTMSSAIEVVEFFRSHLDRVLPLIGDHSARDLVGVAARIIRFLNLPEIQDIDGWVPRSVLSNRLRNVPADELSRELAHLGERSIIESRTVSTATKPSEQWRIVVQTHSSYSDYSDYSGSMEPVEVNFPNNPNSTNGLVRRNGHASEQIPPPCPDDLEVWMQ